MLQDLPFSEPIVEQVLLERQVDTVLKEIVKPVPGRVRGHEKEHSDQDSLLVFDSIALSMGCNICSGIPVLLPPERDHRQFNLSLGIDEECGF